MGERARHAGYPMNRAVFLDRDGVINRVVLRGGRPYPPASLEEFEYLPGVEQAVESLRRAGFKLVVVTNQPDVSKGTQPRHVVEAMHQRIRDQLKVDELKVCYHVDEDGCGCRKPKPGMLLEAATEHSLDLERSFMVGDRWRDVEAGKAVGCRTIFLEANYDERQAESPDAVVGSLLEASNLILSWAD